MKKGIKKVRNLVKSPSTLVLICCTFYAQQSLAQTVVEKPLLAKTAPDLKSELSAVNAPSAENAILGLWINGVDLQQEAFILNIHQQRYIECTVLQQGFVDISQLSSLNQNNIQYCLIENASFSSEIDTQRQLFKLNIPAQYMHKQNLATQQRFIPDMPNLGGFINYNVYYQDGDYTKQVNASTDLNLFWKNMLFNSSHLFRKTYHDQQVDDQDSSRLNTSLSFEFPEKMTTLKLGDNVSNYTGLNQSFYFGGLSFGTNFSGRPNFTYWNTPSVQGSALTQSTVDLMINGSQAYNAKVNPGQYNIDSNIGFSGLGDAQIIVKDILGNTTVQNISVFVDQRLLRPGLTDYNFSVGKLRYNYAYEDDDYRDWFGSGYVRKGITSATTLGATADYSKKLRSAGLLWSQYLSKLGLFEVNSAYSHADELSLEGYTVNTEFKRNTQNYSIGLRSQYYSADFRMLGLDDYSNHSYLPAQESQIYVSKSQIPYLNNLSLSYIERKFREESNSEDQQLFNLSTSRSLSKNLFGSLGISYDAESNDRASVDLRLSYNFDNNKQSLSLNQHNDDETYLQLNQYSEGNIGFDYTIGASRSHDVYSGNLSTTLKTNAGDLGLQYLQTDDQKYYSANYMGSLVWLGNRLDLSTYIWNSFALVRIDDTPDVDIYSNGSYIGKTNKNGEIFSYNLYGYSENTVIFDESQISIDDSFAHTSRSIMPINQRGYIIDFPMSNTASNNITFKFLDQNQQPLESGSMVNIEGIAQSKYPINSQNLVTVYGLNPQSYSIKVQTSNQTCSSQFTLTPDINQDEVVILTCK